MPVSGFNKPGEVNIARRNLPEPPQLGRVPRPVGPPRFHLEVSRSSSFAVRFARRGSSEIYSPAVDIAEDREIKTDTEMPF